MSKIVLYKCLTHHGVQSNLQEAIELKALRYLFQSSKTRLPAITFNSMHSHAEESKYSRTFRVEGCPRLVWGQEALRQVRDGGLQTINA